MTITPAEFGNVVGNVSYGNVPMVLPCREIPARWCDGDPPSQQYHRNRARAHVDVGAGEQIDLKYRLDGTAAQAWEENHAGVIANTWTDPYSSANETPYHPYAHDPVPNSTTASQSHRYIVARIRFKKDAASGDVELNGFQIGWPMDIGLAVDSPELELGDRTGAHCFDAYYSGSAWHIAQALLGTMQRLLYNSTPRIAVVLADDR
jgi:hypothetical protein